MSGIDASFLKSVDKVISSHYRELLKEREYEHIKHAFNDVSKHTTASRKYHSNYETIAKELRLRLLSNEQILSLREQKALYDSILMLERLTDERVEPSVYSATLVEYIEETFKALEDADELIRRYIREETDVSK
jgi:hypothetical protein